MGSLFAIADLRFAIEDVDADFQMPIAEWGGGIWNFKFEI